MAKRKVNKSDKIREYLAEHPDASPKTIQAALKEQGVSVSTGLCSNVKYTSPKGPGAAKQKKKPSNGRRRGRPPKSASSNSSSSKSSGSSAGNAFTAEELRGAKGLIDSLGGVAKAKEALALLEDLG